MINMRIIFVHHGETKEGKKGIILGSLGGNLTVKGKQEVKRIISELIGKKILPDIIITSPLKRALNTAQLISKIIKVPIVIEPLIRERSAGIAEGKRESEIDWEVYERKSLVHRKHTGGESFSDVYKRAKKFVQKIKGQRNKQTILIVSHSVFILMCIAVLKETSIEYILKHKPKRLLIIIEVK